MPTKPNLITTNLNSDKKTRANFPKSKHLQNIKDITNLFKTEYAIVIGR